MYIIEKEEASPVIGRNSLKVSERQPSKNVLKNKISVALVLTKLSKTKNCVTRV